MSECECVDVNVSQRCLSCFFPSESRRKLRSKRSNELFTNIPSTYATHTRTRTHIHSHSQSSSCLLVGVCREWDKHTCNNTYKHAYLCTSQWPMADGRWMTLRPVPEGGITENLTVPRGAARRGSLAKSRRHKQEWKPHQIAGPRPICLEYTARISIIQEILEILDNIWFNLW